MVVVGVLLFLLSLPVLIWAGYLAALTVLSRKLPEPEYGKPTLRFAVVIPAHNEEDRIEVTVRSLALLDWPQELFHIVVVADNCTDRTADKALHAGAAVLVQSDPAKTGRGAALAFAFETLMEGEDAPDAFVVIDADSTAAPNLLRAFAAHFETGEVAVQAEVGLRNPDSSAKGRLTVIALALFHAVRSLARERLGVSVGLRGNGMAISSKVLREVPHTSDDLEYRIRLGRAGIRVAYAHDGLVLGSFVAGDPGMRRLELARTELVPLVREAIEKKSKLLADLVFDLLLPSLPLLAGAALVGSVLSLAIGSIACIPWLLALTAIGVHVVRGVIVSGTKL
jgi:cellulose synthase/poly-beta-1,6-N-acetylglucosamine synthase-like glycosyltransferase